MPPGSNTTPHRPHWSPPKQITPGAFGGITIYPYHNAKSLFHQIPNLLRANLASTPTLEAVIRRQMAMKERILLQPLLQRFKQPVCAITQKSCSFFALVETCHMMSFTANKKTRKIWGWALGYIFSNSLNVDTRLNGMFLWRDIHKMLDAHILIILLTAWQIARITKLLEENEVLDIGKKNNIPEILQKEMADDGWTYNALLYQQDGHEVITRHDLDSEDTLWVTTSVTKEHRAPCRITFYATTSPIFVLANFAEHFASDDNMEFPSFWNDDERARARECIRLINSINLRIIPATYLPQPPERRLRNMDQYATYVADPDPQLEPSSPSRSVTPLFQDDEEEEEEDSPTLDLLARRAEMEY